MQGSRPFLVMLRTATCAAMALGLLSAPVMAGSFRTGTDSQSTRFDSTRVSTGVESIKATRDYSSSLSGTSHKQFSSFSGSAENARFGQRAFVFAEGDTAVDADLVSTGNGVFGIGAVGGGTPAGGGGVGAFGNLGQVGAAGSIGAEFDGMTGSGSEQYVDGSFNLAAESGTVDVNYNQSESGASVYKMNGTFSEARTEDGTTSSGGSVFSIN